MTILSQVTEVLLRVNDDLNNAFLRYDRLERYLTMSTTGEPAGTVPTTVSSTAAPPTAAPPTAAPPAAAEQSLIDFGGSEATSQPRVSASALAAHVDSMSLTPGTNISNISDVSSGDTARKSAGKLSLL